MVRQIIHIDEEKCNGCGICANACHEGAIDIVDGKAKLVRENFCDGFGDCLPGCPTGAITFEEREAPEYVDRRQNYPVDDFDRSEVMKNAAKAKKEEARMSEEMRAHAQHEVEHREGGGCPGSRMMTFNTENPVEDTQGQTGYAPVKPVSRLQQWPVQIKLLPTEAPFYDGAKLLIAADCTAYAYANMHEEFMKGKVTLIGCPKLDAVDYTEKLTEIIKNNDIKSVTIVRMEVPCCGGLQMAAQNALQASGKFIPWQVVTISRDGKIID